MQKLVFRHYIKPWSKVGFYRETHFTYDHRVKGFPDSYANTKTGDRVYSIQASTSFSKKFNFLKSGTQHPTPHLTPENYTLFCDKPSGNKPQLKLN